MIIIRSQEKSAVHLVSCSIFWMSTLEAMSHSHKQTNLLHWASSSSSSDAMLSAGVSLCCCAMKYFLRLIKTTGLIVSRIGLFAVMRDAAAESKETGNNYLFEGMSRLEGQGHVIIWLLVTPVMVTSAAVVSVVVATMIFKYFLFIPLLSSSDASEQNHLWVDNV